MQNNIETISLFVLKAVCSGSNGVNVIASHLANNRNVMSTQVQLEDKRSGTP